MSKTQDRTRQPEGELGHPYTISTRSLISNTDRLFQRIVCKATLGMERSTRSEVRGGLVGFRFGIIERALPKFIPLLR
jgi:hypothetical protein